MQVNVENFLKGSFAIHQKEIYSLAFYIASSQSLSQLLRNAKHMRACVFI